MTRKVQAWIVRHPAYTKVDVEETADNGSKLRILNATEAQAVAAVRRLFRDAKP